MRILSEMGHHCWDEVSSVKGTALTSTRQKLQLSIKVLQQVWGEGSQVSGYTAASSFCATAGVPNKHLCLSSVVSKAWPLRSANHRLQLQKRQISQNPGEQRVLLNHRRCKRETTWTSEDFMFPLPYHKNNKPYSSSSKWSIIWAYFIQQTLYLNWF